MIRTLAAAAMLLLPAIALGQTQFEGLDLTDEPKKPEQVPAQVSPPTPAPLAVEEVKAPPPLTGSAVERNITQEDRVKSVQRKLYLKRGRFELTPYVGTSLNDPFYIKYNETVRVAYYLADTFALSVRGSLFQLVKTEDVKKAKPILGNIFRSVPFWSVLADAEWSPLYGKVAFMNSILHFDGYVLAGAGVVGTETTSGGAPLPAADLGLGMRFVAKDFLAVNLSLVNTSYVDAPAGSTNRGILQNMLMLNVGLSLFVPLKSTFREAE